MSPSLAALGRAAALFFAAAVAVGCYLPYSWLRKGGPAPWLAPIVASLTMFVWMLSFHPTRAAHAYAAFAGVYVTAAVLWLCLVERQRPSRSDLVGASVCLVGMGIIVFTPQA